MSSLKVFLLSSALYAGILCPAAHAKFSTPLELWDQAYGDNKPRVSLYKDESNPYIQEFNITLRAQYQGAMVRANQGEYDGSHHSTSEWRRFRLGGNIKFLEHFRLTNIWNMGGLDTLGYRKNGVWYDHGTSRGNIYDASLIYDYKEAFSVGIGKHYPNFFAENRMSSGDYRAPEAPALENQFAANSGFGVKIFNDESKHDLGWQLAVWSNTEERSRGTWGTWQSAYTLVGVSYKADKVLMKEGRVYLDWVHNMQDMGDMATAQFRDTYTGTTARDVFALYYRGKDGPASLMLEALWANSLASYKQNDRIITPSNAFGLVVMPMYMLNDHIEWVARYQWSKGNDAVKLYARYSSLSPTNGSYVDEFHAIGTGFNFYLFANDRQRFKFMTFVEYSNTNKRRETGGFTGWTFIGGVYTNF